MMNYNKQIEVRYKTDILVVGGGPAGVSAAVMAARSGKDVMLVEACGALGGMGTLGRVPMFCQFTDGFHFLAGGFGKEVYELCFKNGAIGPDDYLEHTLKHGSVGINNEKLKSVYDDLAVNAGVRILFFTKIFDVVKDGTSIQYAVCCGQSSVFAIEADIFIDCSGDGILSFYAGAECLKGDNDGAMQSGTLCSLWSDIDWETVKKEGFMNTWPQNDNFLEKAYVDRVFDRLDLHLPGMWRTGKTTGGGNIGHVFKVDGTDEVSLTKAMLEGRRRLKQYEMYYKKYLKGFENMELQDTGSLMGIRETRRVTGDYILTADDYYNRASFPDEIGRYNYSIDLHASECDHEHFYESVEELSKTYEDGESYGIPYRSLAVKDIENLLTAGRCISADHKMQGSVRVMPACFITGQAAGLAACLAASNLKNVHSIDVKKLQKMLSENGAYLPMLLS